MIRVGIAGLGFMGMVHSLSHQRLRRVKVAAIYEIVVKRLKGDWRETKGNFGPAGQQMDPSRIATNSDVEGCLRG